MIFYAINYIVWRSIQKFSPLKHFRKDNWSRQWTMQFVVRWRPSHKITMANVTSPMWRRGQFNNIIPKKVVWVQRCWFAYQTCRFDLFDLEFGHLATRQTFSPERLSPFSIQKETSKCYLVAGLTIALIVPNQCIVVVERTLYCICYGRKELTWSQHVVTRKPVKYKKIINSPLFTLGSI